MKLKFRSWVESVLRVRTSVTIAVVLLLFLLAWQLVGPKIAWPLPHDSQVHGSSLVTEEGPSIQSKVKMRHFKYEVERVMNEDEATYVFIWKTPEGTEERLTPEQHAARLFQTTDAQTWMEWVFLVLNITGWISLIWVVLGFGGQIMFTGRMVVQWLVSEKKGQSVVPPLFWWMSLGGASLLIVYFIWRKDIVGVLGQSTGWFIYIRNIILIYKPKSKDPTVMDDPGPEPELGE